MKKVENSRLNGLFVNFYVYILAFVVGIIPFLLCEDYLLSTLLFTVCATLIVFVFSLILQNVSIYDPYWSVAPLVYFLAALIKYNLWNINSILLLIVISLWSNRLTYNWYTTFKDIHSEDWRYHDFREKCGKFSFFFINLTGFEYMPTFLVYLGMIPALLLAKISDFSSLSLIGYIIIISGVVIETISDLQLHKFITDQKGVRNVCQKGLWNYSRHPNYLGEIMVWVGLYLAYILTELSSYYWGIGMVLMIGLFTLISIPLAEKHHLQRRPDYKIYQKTTSSLLLLPKRKVK